MNMLFTWVLLLSLVFPSSTVSTFAAHVPSPQAVILTDVHPQYFSEAKPAISILTSTSLELHEDQSFWMPLNSATVPISVTTDGFSPDVVTIFTGDTVVWTNLTANPVHIQSGVPPYSVYLPLVFKNYASQSQAQSEAAFSLEQPLQNGDVFSGTVPVGGTFSYTFNIVGDYPYFASNFPQLTGRIIVEAAPFDFTLDVLPASQSVAQGESITYTVQTTLVSGDSQPVSLTISGLPEGAVASFGQSSLTPPDSTVLTVTADLATPTGSYTLTVSGSGGDYTHQAAVSLEVAPHPDFTLDAVPPSQSVAQGQAVTYTVSLDALYDFDAPVSLSVSGVPTGTTASFGQSPITPPGSTVLTINVANDSPTGSYPLVISGDGGGWIHSAPVTLTITQGTVDLLVNSLIVSPLPATITQTVTITAVVINLGTNNAEEPFVVDWSAEPAWLPPATPIYTGTWIVAGLVAGQSVTLTDTRVFSPGVFSLIVEADSTQVITETNESNNTRIGEVGVTGTVELCGDITQDATWAYATYVLTCGITVQPGVTLTVRNGAVVKPKYGGSIFVDGNLLGTGTDTLPVSFTSYLDDAYGGDTNQDGDQTQPGPGNWGAVNVHTGGLVNFTNAMLRFGTTSISSQSGTITLDHSTVEYFSSNGVYSSVNGVIQVGNSLIQNNSGYGLYYSASGPVAPVITGTSFLTNTSYAIYFDPSDVTTLDGTQIYNNTALNNGTNGLRLEGTYTGTSTLSGDLGFAYVLANMPIINPDSHFIIQAGAVLKAVNSGGGGALTGMRVNGVLEVNGTAEQPVVFTSLTDDSYAGDTNNDGGATLPAAGYWSKIVVGTGGSATFTHAFVRYAGAYNWYEVQAGIQNTGGALTLADTTVEYTAGTGVYVDDSGTVVVQNTVIQNNSTGLYIGSTSSAAAISNSELLNNTTGINFAGTISPIIQNCTFEGNTSYGLYNSAAFTIDATGNWWGSVSGPTHPSNPGGTGDAVSNLVIFAPWLLVEP